MPPSFPAPSQSGGGGGGGGCRGCGLHGALWQRIGALGRAAASRARAKGGSNRASTDIARASFSPSPSTSCSTSSRTSSRTSPSAIGSSVLQGHLLVGQVAGQPVGPAHLLYVPVAVHQTRLHKRIVHHGPAQSHEVQGDTGGVRGCVKLCPLTHLGQPNVGLQLEYEVGVQGERQQRIHLLFILQFGYVLLLQSDAAEAVEELRAEQIYGPVPMLVAPQQALVHAHLLSVCDLPSPRASQVLWLQEFAACTVVSRVQQRGQATRVLRLEVACVCGGDGGGDGGGG
mmetsp:Transcript_27637/g.62628  ORF Transcript_27637/g.62628 Transcript_27637/m.62628 type:complete len:286 (-) Transcript_27637:441-1298(-)